MRIILKHTLRNIISKPFRAFVLIFCITIVAASGYFMLDMSGAMKSAMMNMLYESSGNADIIITNKKGIEFQDLEGCPEFSSIDTYSKTEIVYKKDKNYYNYEFTDKIFLNGLDTKAALKMGMLAEEFELSDNEVAVNQKYKNDYGCDVGDTVIFHNKDNDPVEYKVVKILADNNKFLSENTCGAVISKQSYIKNIELLENKLITKMYIDVTDDDKIQEFIDVLKEKSPHTEFENLKGDEYVDSLFNSMTSFFTFLFVISFLLVIFISVGLSNRIVCERMSVIGTLRSIGISRKITTAILLTENVIYGITGAGIGTAVYLLMKSSIFAAMDIDEFIVDATPVMNIIIIFIFSVLVECISPVFTLAKAVNTAIRDIIFSNKDTEYKLSLKGSITGAVFLVVAVLASLLGGENMIPLVVGIISAVFAVALLIPLFLKGVSVLLTRLFVKLKMPVASLASSEICSKKSTVSSAVLSAAAVCISMTIYILSVSEINSLSNIGYNADAMVFGTQKEKYIYSFVEDIEGVNGVEYIYSYYDKLNINEEKTEKDFQVISLPDNNYFDLIPELPDSLEKDEFIISKSFAKKYQMEIGDTFKLELMSNGVFPVYRELTLTGYANTTNFNNMTPVIIINKQTYIDVYGDFPEKILIKCDNSEEVVQKLNTYIIERNATIYTIESYKEEETDSKMGIISIYLFLMVLGVVLTVIGTSGNQVIGFEGRRREYAVMYSTSMDRTQIKNLIFLENAISTGVSVILASGVSIALSGVAERIFDAISMPVEMHINVGEYIIAGIILWAVLMFTCISPVNSLRKMNIAAELKYE